MAISRLIDFGKQVWNVRARSEETKRPSCPANTDLKYVVVKRSTCKGAIAAAAKSYLGVFQECIVSAADRVCTARRPAHQRKRLPLRRLQGLRQRLSRLQRMPPLIFSKW